MQKPILLMGPGNLLLKAGIDFSWSQVVIYTEKVVIKMMKVASVLSPLSCVNPFHYWVVGPALVKL